MGTSLPCHCDFEAFYELNLEDGIAILKESKLYF
jgi:hypothetical protein